jgi:undecaprenyl-diphosphatase
MSWLEAIVLGAIQGLTEFLPISSDGHLVLAQNAFAAWDGLPRDQSQALFFIILLHLGTLGAILAFYRAEVVRTARGLLGREPEGSPFARANVIRAGLLAAVATLPAVVVGLTLKHRVEAMTQSITPAGWGFIVTGCVLLLSMRLSGGTRGFERTGWLDALLIGTMQAVAILPGVSRSGLTITTALALGLTRSWSVGFSLLLAVVAIAGANVLEFKDFQMRWLDTLDPMRTIVGVLVSGVVGYGAVVWLSRIVSRGRLWYFSVYLFVLAAVVLIGMRGTGGAVDGTSSGAYAAGRADRAGTVAAGPGVLVGPDRGALAGPDREGSDRAPDGDGPVRLDRPAALDRDVARPLGGDPSESR